MKEEMEGNEGQQGSFNRLRTALGILIPLTGLFFLLDVPLYLFRVCLFNQQFLGIFWALTTATVYITVPVSKKRPRNRPQWYDFVLAVLSLVVGGFVLLHYPRIVREIGRVAPEEVVLGFLAVVLVLEATRRTSGFTVCSVILVFLAYAKFGYLIPGILGTGKIGWGRLFQQLYLGTEFMFGIPLTVTIGIVFGFIFFGIILQKTGAGDFIMDLACALMGKYRGGPAKVAIVASSLFGTISGSSVANVSATGVFTIPLMKRIGYPAHYAGAIEAVASTGGQLMPPIMGAAAFVMAEFLGIPYSRIIIVAIIPALFYYIGMFLQVDFQAIQRGLKGLPKDQIPSLRETFRKGWWFVLPVAVLLYALFGLFQSAGVSAILAAAATVVISLFRRETRRMWSWRHVLDIMWTTTRAMFEIVSVCAAAGFLVGLIAYTGLGISFSQILTQAAGGSLILLAILTAVASIILGMGMPTVPAYIMLAVLAVPAMVKMGVQPIVAHMFVMYFGSLSMITPPVCLSVFAAVPIAKASTSRIALQAMELGIAGYIVPFVILFNPGLMLMGGSVGETVWAIFFCLIIVALCAGAFEGYFFGKLSWLQRGVYGVLAVLLMYPNRTLRIALCSITVLIWAYELLMLRRARLKPTMGGNVG